MDLDIIRRRIEKAVREAFEEYQAQEDVKTKFAEPSFGYISTVHPMFDTFFAGGRTTIRRTSGVRAIR